MPAGSSHRHDDRPLKRSRSSPCELGACVQVLALIGFAAVATVAMPLLAAPEQVFDKRQIVREIGYIPMKEGVRLAYVVHRPRRDGRFPVLITYDPYGSSGMLATDRTPRKMLQNSCAVVGVNIRGPVARRGRTGFSRRTKVLTAR